MAAGLGFKDFTTGEVLTAADVDGYLMQGIWVFASAAARDAAVTSPQEGNFAFTKDTNGLWYYDGSTWAASGSSSSFAGVSLYKSGNQSLSSGAGVNATFDTELFDTNSYHSTSSNTDRITIPSGKDGYYLVTARANFAASSTGIRIGMIRKNAGATQLARFTMNNQTASVDAVMEVSTIVNLVATDYIVFEVYQDGTGSLNLQGGGEQYTTFSALFLGA